MKGLCLILAILALGGSILGQSANSKEIVPGDNLVVEGIPKIPASLAETAGRYTRSRWATLSSWHPTKREMLISTQFGDTAQLHYLKFPGGARTQLTFSSDEIVGGGLQPKTGNCFVFRKDTDGDQFYQIYRYDIATGGITLLTDGHSRNEAPVWSNSGDLLIYGSNRRNQKDMDLWVMNPLDPKSNKMVAQLEGGFWIPFDWSPDDRKVLAYQHISANKTNLWVIDSKTGSKTLITPQEENENVAHWFGQFSADGKGVYVTTDRDSEFQRIAYIDLATKQYTFLTDRIREDVDEFDLSPDGSVLAFVTNEDGLGRLHLLDTRERKERRVPDLPVGVVYGIHWNPNGTELGYGFSSARYPDDVYSLDIQTNKVERWTFSESGGINTDQFKEAEVIRWPSFDSRPISGLLYRPPARFSGRRPPSIWPDSASRSRASSCSRQLPTARRTRRKMTEIHQRYSQDQIAAVRAGADQAAGGATRGTSITMGGITRGASIEMRANKAMLEGSIAAAGQIRDASLQAAKLHMAATIVHHMTRDAARQIEQGLTMRY